MSTFVLLEEVAQLHGRQVLLFLDKWFLLDVYKRQVVTRHMFNVTNEEYVLKIIN